MSVELLAILITAAFQMGGIIALGVMAYRQGDRYWHRHFTPGEAAIYKEMRRVLDQE